MSEALRLAVCLYGGNARLPFEGGVALALTELVIASRRQHGHAAPPGFAWLEGLDVPLPDVHVDVVSGASAGGVVGALLGKMLINSADPEGDFRVGAELFIDRMDVQEMRRDRPHPTALFDKDGLTLEGFAHVIDGREADPAQCLEPTAELWLALTHAPGLVELFELDEACLLEDVSYLEQRRFDGIDFRHRKRAVVETVHATSANPFVFAPYFIDDQESPEGIAAWLRQRAPHDPGAPDVRDLEAPPPPRVPVSDGGALDNRPLGPAIDACFRRGAGIGPDQRLYFLLVDPNAETTVERFGVLAERARDGVRGGEYEDQLSHLLRTYEMVRHERISEDLRRLVQWRERARVLARRAPRTTVPQDDALIEAADRIAFSGAVPGGRDEALLLQVAYFLAGRPHADPARQALLLSGRRVRTLIRLLRLWHAVARERPALAAPRLALLDQLVERERAHVARACADVQRPSDEALNRLVDEALLGAPLPSRADLDPVRLTVRRIGPPPEGLASNEGEGFAGFLDRAYRSHDLLMGVIAGRRAVANMLGAAGDAWRAHFGLGDSTAEAARWFRDAPPSCLPWARWLADFDEVTAWRGPDWRTLPADERQARENRRLYPAAMRLGAHASRRIWAMSAVDAVRKDRPVYRLARGVFAFFSRSLVPWLFRAESRALARDPHYKLFTRTRQAVVIVPVLYACACALVAALVLGVPAYTAVMWAGLTFVVGLGPPFVTYLLAARDARARLATPPDAAPGPSDRPDGPRSGGPAP